MNLSVKMEFTQDEEEPANYSIHDHLFRRLVQLPDLITWDITTVDEKV